MYGTRVAVLAASRITSPWIARPVDATDLRRVLRPPGVARQRFQMDAALRVLRAAAPAPVLLARGHALLD
jgi:hypothetical protein